MSPASSLPELDAILHGAAIAPITDRAFLRISGPDATRWLNGMVTNSIQSLAPGEGNYNFLLNAQGRIQADCTLYREPAASGAEPSFLLVTDKAQIDTIHPLLDRFIIMDDVELTTAGADDAGLLLLGPKAAATVESFLTDLPRPLRLATFAVGDLGRVQLTTPSPAIAPQFSVLGPVQALSVVHAAAIAQGATPVSTATLEAFRIFSGIPRYGTDIRNTETARDLPQETDQTHALHFSKGCYVGQEIVERIHSRGQVHRTFTRFLLTPDETGGEQLPSLPATLQADGKPAGELTSAAWVPLASGPQLLALGYIRREALELRKQLTYPGGTAIPHPASELLANAGEHLRP